LWVEQLPPGSEIFNPPEDLFSRHQSLALLFALGMLQLTIIVTLRVNRAQRAPPGRGHPLRLSKEKHSLLLQKSSGSIFSFARDGIYLYLNNDFAMPIPVKWCTEVTPSRR
jgi:hypothetical protein